MRLSHNLASLNVYRSYVKDLKSQSIAMSRISSGYRINKAGEGPNAIAKSERFRLQIRGLQMANKNVQDGISMLQTAEGGLNGITESLQRIRELLVEGGGVTSKSDKKDIKIEINQMLDSIESLANRTDFNGVNILNNNDVIKTQVGNNVDEQIAIQACDVTSKGLNLKDSSGKYLIDLTDTNAIDNSIGAIDEAIEKVLKARSKFGALENRFESSYNDLGDITDRVIDAESSIRDADIAEEMMKLAKNNILVEAGNAMMVQTNQFPKDVLRILERLK
ncbi:flagellin [Clostridium tepidiprofundi DSM 19306]|uniref:Flagellin n=1 Tax=Clostridium tepidiprofundi DSM 19306 TaxID=1121338 RepID=A0A151B7Y2_9CLOT|nr:flagellin [Clostridium tepidiprofundi]KYH36035.1 flagellin [Clostridium tepidiprofundi DSM 19306]